MNTSKLLFYILLMPPLSRTQSLPKVGLPMSRYGCPDQMTTNWTRGSVSVQSKGGEGEWAEHGMALAGPYSPTEFELTTCKLDSDTVEWPVASYCLFGYTDQCPQDFEPGFLFVKPGGSFSPVLGGVVPAHVTEEGLLTRFCCRKAVQDKLATAPFSTPFLLLPDLDDSCPQFQKWKSSQQHHRLSNASLGNHSTRVPWKRLSQDNNIHLTFCSYEPEETLKDPCEPGWEAFQGYCYQFQSELRPWDEAEKMCQLLGANMHSVHSKDEMDFIQNMTQYLTNVFPRPPEINFENYWTGLNDIEVEGLWAYSDGTPNEESVYTWAAREPNDWLSGEDCQEWRIYANAHNDFICYIPRRSICKKPQLSVTTDVAAGKPTRQSSTEDNLKASLAVDNQLSITCTQTSKELDAWWQIDLRESHTIYGIQLVMGPTLPGPMTVTVSLLPDDFRSMGGETCMSDLLLHQRVSIVRCLQPIKGQYVTIQVNQAAENPQSSRLEICNVYVYGTGSSCGIPLGLATGEVSAVQLSASSYQGRDFPHQARLHSPGAWCSQEGDLQAYLQMEFASEHIIYGLEINGLDANNYVASFSLLSKQKDESMSVYQEHTSMNKVFHASNGSRSKHVLQHPIRARIIRLLILSSIGKPCMQLELLECKTAAVVACDNKAGMPALNFTHTPRTSSAIIEHLFPCASRIASWELFWQYSGIDVAIVIWQRNQANSYAVASHVTYVSAQNAGRQRLVVNSTPSVGPDDMVGIHVISSRDGIRNVPVPYAIKGEDGILLPELSPVLFFNSNMPEIVLGSKLNMSDLHRPAQQREYTAMAINAELLLDEIESTGTCGGWVRSEGTLLSPHYPAYYGSSLQCSWQIVAPPGQFIRLSFLDIDLTTNDRNGDRSCDPGSFSITPCSDTMTIQSFRDESFDVTDQTVIVRTLRGQENVMVISDTRFLQLELSSCIRDSPMAARGFKANISFTEYYGCCMGKSDCANCQCLNSNHGYISSANHPFRYPSNQACNWKIVVTPGNFIALTVETMDVASLDSKCQEDYVNVRDTNYNGEAIGDVHTFCNHAKPKTAFQSSWHFLLVHFYSDSTTMGVGFLARYESKTFGIEPQLEQQIDYNGSQKGCAAGDIHYNTFCYHFGLSTRPLVWIMAEDVCKALGGHLVSIMSEEEMKVLHYLLTTRWRTDRREAYIGLYDRKPRSQFWWTDSRPLIYTAWASKLDNNNIQPDGADLESCTMIQLSNLHSINHWHDIPCSTDTVHQYICKMEANNSDSNLQEDWNIIMSPEENCGTELFSCGSGGCVQPTFVCNGLADCPDGADEANCSASCSTSEFQCNDGECIQLSKYCDYVSDCGDDSDESECVYPVCEGDEWPCDNGQCIPLHRRCDVIPDCVDGSDEQEKYCNLFCSPEDTVQCFWGKCVPQHTWCDTVVDCAGTLEEDERNCEHTRAQNCADLRAMGYPAGHYKVRPGLLDAVEVQCEHNLHFTATSIPLSEFESSLEGTFANIPLIYGESRAIREQVRAIVESADTCWQDLHISCNHQSCITSVTLTSDIDEPWEVDISHWNCSCPQRRDRVETSDLLVLDLSGTLTITSVLVVLETESSDPKSITGNVMALPIHCTEDTSDKSWPEMFKCKSGQFVEARYRCILEFNKYGLPLGCRDMSHLIGCESVNALDKECSWFTYHLQYWGGQARARANQVCQRWDVQQPHLHSYHSTELFGGREAADQENYCRIPYNPSVDLPDDKDLRVPWCLVANPLDSIQTCSVPPCGDKSAFSEWIEMGVIDFPYEPSAVPCDVPTCDPDIIGVKLPYQCLDNYVKCPGDYCIPERYICDGTWHCPDGQDEANCENFSCPGMYICSGEQQNCLPKTQLCDGIAHCRHGDDELYCDVSCPVGCTCHGYIFTCANSGFMEIPHTIVSNTRKLDMSNNSISLTYAALGRLPYLGELDVSKNQIQSISQGIFAKQKNLYSLDLSHNQISHIPMNAFFGLNNLKHLNITGNYHLKSLAPGAFLGLSSLPVLDLSGSSLEIILEGTFEGLVMLHSLHLARNKIHFLEELAFVYLDGVRNLDISGNSLETVFPVTFQKLVGLEFLTSDSFKLCCFASQVAKQNCLPPQDEISSCSDLMRNNILRSFLWILGSMAFVGNIFVIWYRYKYSSNAVSELGIFHLGISDFFMGLYMLCIGCVDVYYRGVYIEYAEQWRADWGCQILGFLATLSSEGSVLFLCLITIDRFLCLVFPFGGVKLTTKSAKRCIAFIWLLSFILAGLPLLPIPYFGGKFYSRSGVCMALPITAETPPGWEYSTALFIGFNLVGFLVIAVGYSVMYIVINKAGKRAKRGKNKAQITLAKNMMLIVMTDFVCWLPIIIMGLLALRGMKLSGEVYAWTIVFIMPINSAINPLLYSYSSVKQRRLTAKKKHAPGTISGSSLPSVSQNRTNKAKSLEDNMTQRYFYGEAWSGMNQCRLSTILKDNKPSVHQILHIAKRLAATLHAVHAMGMVHGNLNSDNIIATNLNEGIRIYLTGFLYDETAEDFDTYEDMENLGILLKTMIRSVSQMQTKTL